MSTIFNISDKIKLSSITPLLLDIYPSSAVAYSLRQLLYNTTDVVRVRRSSDNAEADFNPTEITDGTLTSFVGSENLFFPSETFTGWGNIGGSTITSNTTETNDPFGGSNATKVVAGSSVLIYKGTFTNVVRTQTFYAKAGTCETFGIYFGSGFNATFNISVDSPSVNSTINTTATITAVGDGWYRCSATLTSLPASDYFAGVNFSPTSGTTFYIFGAQLEGGTSASEYNKTTTNIGGYGYVTTWYDQSGNSNDATQGAAASQPKIVDAGVLVEENGKPAVDFDGVDDSLTTSNGLAFPLFNIAVVKYGEALKSGAYGYTGQGRDRMCFGMGTFTPTNAFWAWTPLVLSSYGEANSRDLLQHIHTYYIPDATESNWKYYRDSVEKGGVGLSSGTALTTAGASLFIGYSGNGSEYWTGPIQEIIYYPSDQSSNRVGIETNINNHYNIY